MSAQSAVMMTSDTDDPDASLGPMSDGEVRPAILVAAVA